MARHVPDQNPECAADWQPDGGSSVESGPPAIETGRSFVRFNWPLWLGGLIIALFIALAVFGSFLAPQDPMQENLIIRVGDDWETPPFAPFTVPGFPLGSDQFGRDLLSRLLLAIRPTLVMVVVVAAVRLVLGIAIGMGAGWSEGRFGHALDAAIGAALSVPVLIVALAAIAIIGVEYGLLAFAIGLSITGWVETARYVRDQTQLVKGSLYIEAARALGASDGSILTTHVLRQIMPMVWMLFSFEIGNTLMTTAGLGFLGYYVGGEVWVDVDDFVARRLSGMPELGQMLAAAWNEQHVITEPWGMIIAGSAIFLAIAGFTLLGEGLRLRLGVDRPRRSNIRAELIDQVRAWTGSVRAVGKDRADGGRGILQRRWLVASVVVIALAVAGALIVRANREVERPESESEIASGQLDTPTEHLWPADRHDAQGTLWSDVPGPVAPGVQWVFQDATGFAGGPAVSRDERLYIASQRGILYALEASGQIAWEFELPGSGVGTPALDKAGNVYVADEFGGISALSPEGEILWSFEPDAKAKATTSPIITQEGTIIYPSGGMVRAVSATGEMLWETHTPYGFNPLPPRLNQQEDALFFLATAFDPEDGTIIDMTSLTTNAGNEQYVVGADGETYYRSEGRIIHWKLNGTVVETLEGLTRRVPGHAKDAGTTADGTVWALYGVGYNSPHSGIVWLDWTDQVLGNIEFEQSPAVVIGVDQDAIVYTCGSNESGAVECVAAEPGAGELAWRLTVGEDDSVTGGALVPGKLYVAVESGLLYALADEDLDGQPLSDTTREPPITVARMSAEAVTLTPTPKPKAAMPTPQPALAPSPAETAPQTTSEIAAPGQLLTYTLQVMNNGPSDATGVVLTDTLPEAVALVGAVTSQGSGCQDDSGTLECRLGDLGSQASATITLIVRIESALSDSITNTAAVDSFVPDPKSQNNDISQRTRLVAGSDLFVDLAGPPAPISGGDVLTYTATITNLGPSLAANVTITGTLSSGIKPHAHTASPGLYCRGARPQDDAHTTLCTMDLLPPGTAVEVVFSANVPISASEGLTAAVAVQSATLDPSLENNVALTTLLKRTASESPAAP